MQYVDPNFTDGPVSLLGVDGCVYEIVYGECNKLFSYDGWETYVKKNNELFFNGEISLDQFVDAISNIDVYKRISGYDKPIDHHFFGSCQYHSVYQMYFLLQVLSNYGLKTTSIIHSEANDFVPSKNYREHLINYIIAHETAMLSYHDEPYISFGWYQDKIIENPWSFRFQADVEDFSSDSSDSENNKEPVYYYAPFPLDEVSPEHQEIFNRKVEEYKKVFISELKIFGMPVNVQEKVVNRFFEDTEVKHKKPAVEIKHFSEHHFDENSIMWDHDDLVGCDKSSMKHFSIPYEYVPDNYKLKHLERTHKYVMERIKSLLKIKDSRSAVKFYLEHGTMWRCIPRIFNEVYDRELTCPSAPTIKSKTLMNDWSDNYRIGAMIFVMVKNGIVPYANDFYCPNT